MLSTVQERQAAAATVERLTAMGHSYDAAAAIARKVLGDVLVDLGFCDRDTVEAAARAVRETGLPLGQVLHERYELPDRQLAIAIGERFGMRYLSLEQIEPDASVLELVPAAVLRRLDAVPVGFKDSGAVLVVVCDPRLQPALDELSALTGHPVDAAVVTRDDLDEVLRRAGQLEASRLEQAARARAGADPPSVGAGEGPAAELARALIAEAINRGDIIDDGRAVTYRIDMRISIFPVDAP